MAEWLAIRSVDYWVVMKECQRVATKAAMLVEELVFYLVERTDMMTVRKRVEVLVFH